jgi:hypothetical protein
MRMPLISLLHPSRGRPQKAYETARFWIDKSGIDIKNIDYILSLDQSDPNRSEYWTEWDCEIVNNNTCVVEATNHAAKESRGDILVYLSDDFKCPDNWGELVLKEFEGENRPLLIKVDDCLQKFDVPVLTIPIMNRALYERLGYFWHPSYRSMFVDEDLYWTAQKMGAVKYCKHLKFPHEHPANGKATDDETYRRSALNWNQGKAMFAHRKMQGFPV